MYPSTSSIGSDIWPLPGRSRAWGYTSRTRKRIRRVFGSCVVLVTVSKHTTNFRLWYTLRDSSRVTSVREFRWIKYPALRADVVQAVFTHHLNTRSLGLMYAFTSLHEQFNAARTFSFNNPLFLTLRVQVNELTGMTELLVAPNTDSPTLTYLRLVYLSRPHR